MLIVYVCLKYTETSTINTKPKTIQFGTITLPTLHNYNLTINKISMSNIMLLLRTVDLNNLSKSDFNFLTR